MSPRRCRPLRDAIAVLSVGIATLGCGDDEALLEPLSRDAGIEAAVDAAAPETGAPDATPLPMKRQVFQRNPFGNVAASDNLLWDGDFEWHSSFGAQYGWVNAVTVISVGAFSQVRASAQCKSGLKCGYLTQNQRVAAIGVSPSKSKVHASLWARVPTADCSDVGVKLISCDYAADPDVPVLDADGVPDADGFCHYEVVAAERQRATCLFVETRFAEGEAIIDDAVLRAAPPGAAQSDAMGAPSARDVEVAEEARRAIKKWLRPGAPAPTRESQELKRWVERRRR